MKFFLHDILVLILLSATGCSTLGRQIAYDNTVEIAKYPMSDTAEIGWRIKTFWTEVLLSSWRRYVSFPVLKIRNVPAICSTGEEMKPEIMTRWLHRRSGDPVAGEIKMLLNGDAFFPEFKNSILSATRRIDLKTYIFDNDDVAKKIADLLIEKAQEIPVRVLYDSAGTRMAWNVHAPSLPKNYIYEVRDMVHYLAAGGIALQRACHTLMTSEHSKYFLIDDLAYFGGMNIGREYRYDWRDAMFEITGPAVNLLKNYFNESWEYAGGTRQKPEQTIENPAHLPEHIFFAVTTPFRAHIYKGQLRAIKNAKQRIYIENPYLWNMPIVYQLCAARKRGVDVRVTVPRDVNHGIGISANKKTVKLLLDHGVRVFIYPGMTHVKAAVYDQWACFGSANFDDLSLHKNYELNIFTSDKDTVEMIAAGLLKQGQGLSTETFEIDITLKELFFARFAQYL
ncbi:MAG: phosphatidylserine/phosphatidylglycerophosphate/cardiolipin synthase family protein [Kiritimatiellales bacterium]